MSLGSVLHERDSYLLFVPGRSLSFRGFQCVGPLTWEV